MGAKLALYGNPQAAYTLRLTVIAPIVYVASPARLRTIALRGQAEFLVALCEFSWKECQDGSASGHGIYLFVRRVN
ncbi:MAG: hypothetical protein Aurels2KO_32200 [Aureliella sp.]